MGCNYYWYEKSACSECGREHEALHIGKSSYGWCFSLRIYPERGIHDLDDWKRLFATPGSRIFDEYGDAVTVYEMLGCITERQFKSGRWDEGSLLRNHAVMGPNGLARHKVDGQHCVKNGAGTWDCIVGEFS